MVTADLRVLCVLIINILNFTEQGIRESLASVLFLHEDILQWEGKTLCNQHFHLPWVHRSSRFQLLIDINFGWLNRYFGVLS